MGIISYAQNFEDVMLWRALQHIEHGFYLDVGAWSPDFDSVTRTFYEHSWCGINVEPNPEFNLLLQERRSRDQNLRLAVGDCEGTLIMNFLGNPGLSTLSDAIAKQHQTAGLSLDRQEVQVVTLATVWRLYVPVGQPVHFLKVDVEGLEEAVLRGNDWTKNRPWIVVVEATLPMSQVESYTAWELVLTAASYHFAYADGLNRFYVANEHFELLPAFKYPPNVFDNFILGNRQQAEVQLAEVEARLVETEARATAAEARANQAETHLTALLNSTFWRLTGPIRWAVTIFRRALSQIYRIIPGRFKASVVVFLAHAIPYVQERPRLYKLMLKMIDHLPAVKQRIKRIANRDVDFQSVPSATSDLAPRARRILTDLETGIKLHQQETD